PITADHGGPARVIIPKRYAWKGAKFIREITFLNRDILGFWEVRGYSNTADPWTEDRFARKDSPPAGFPEEGVISMRYRSGLSQTCRLKACATAGRNACATSHAHGLF